MKERSQRILTAITLTIMITTAGAVDSRPSHSKFLNDLKKAYTEECKQIDQRNLTKRELREEHESLANFMGFARKDPSKIPLKNLEPIDVLSVSGWITMLIPFLVTISTTVGLLMAILFFFFPNVFSLIFKMFVPSYKVEVIEDVSNFDVKKAEYFKVIKGKFNRSQSLLRLFLFRFVLSILLMVMLVFGLAIAVNFDMSSDCGINKTAIDVLEGGEGVDFNEFRDFKRNGSLLQNFNEDLRNYEAKGIDYNKILDEFLLEKAVAVETSFKNFFNFTKDMKFNSCSDPLTQLTPFLLKNPNILINEEISAEVINVLDTAGSLHDGALVLGNFDLDKHKKLEKFVSSSELLIKEVDILYGFYETAYQKVRGYFRDYFVLLSVMSAISFIWFIQAFIMLIPKDTSQQEAIKFSLKFQILSLILGAAILGFCGSYLFLKSQLMVGECLGAYRMLDSPRDLQKYLGQDDKKWADICISSSSKGDIMDFLDDEQKDNFQVGLYVLKGFSLNFTLWKEITQEEEPKSVKMYGRLLDSLMDFDLDGMKDQGEHSYSSVLKDINSNFPNFELQMSEKDCTQGAVTAEFAKMNETKVESFTCFVIKNDYKSLKSRIESLSANITENEERLKLKTNIINLESCLGSYKDFFKIYTDHLKVVRMRLYFLFSHLKNVNRVYKKIRNRFKNSLERWNELGYGDIKKIFSCKGLRGVTERAIASACYNKVYTYGAVITSLCLIGSSIILTILSFISLMELMVDKTVMRKFQELNADNKSKRAGAVTVVHEKDLGDSGVELF